MADEHAATAQAHSRRWAEAQAARVLAQAARRTELVGAVSQQVASMAACEAVYCRLADGALPPRQLRREWIATFVAGTFAPAQEQVGSSATPHLDIAVDNLLKQACRMQQASPAFVASLTVTAADHEAAWEYISAGQPAVPPDMHTACGDSAPAADCTTPSVVAHDVSSFSGKLLWARTLAALFHAANAVLLPAEQPSHCLKLPLRLAVIGLPGSGRSTLATALASRFNLKARAMTHQLIALLYMRTVHI